jgi:hypothetical protein
MTWDEGDPAEVGAGRVPAGDTELRGVAPAVGGGVARAAGVGVTAGLVRVAGFGVAAGGDVVRAGEAGDGVVTGVTAAVGGGLTSR